MSTIAPANNSSNPDRFGEVMDRQTETDRQGESERQQRPRGKHRRLKVRDKMQRRMAR